MPRSHSRSHSPFPPTTPLFLALFPAEALPAHQMPCPALGMPAVAIAIPFHSPRPAPTVPPSPSLAPTPSDIDIDIGAGAGAGLVIGSVRITLVAAALPDHLTGDNPATFARVTHPVPYFQSLLPPPPMP